MTTSTSAVHTHLSDRITCSSRFTYPYLCTCVCVNVYVCVCKSRWRPAGRRHQDTLDLVWQVIVGCLTWVLGNKLRSSERTERALSLSSRYILAFLYLVIQRLDCIGKREFRKLFLNGISHDLSLSTSFKRPAKAKNSGLKILELKSEFSPKPLFCTADVRPGALQKYFRPCCFLSDSTSHLEITETKRFQPSPEVDGKRFTDFQKFKPNRFLNCIHH